MNLDQLQAVAEAATQGEGQSMFTHPRDDANFKNNQTFAVTFDAPTVLALIAVAKAAKEHLDAFYTGKRELISRNALHAAIAALEKP